MKNYAKYWYLVVLLLAVSCADSLLVTSGLTSPIIALEISLVASLAGWVWLVKMIQKDRDQIMACLKNTTIHRPDVQNKNFFGSLFTEALQKIEHSDTELLSAKQVQTILKTRLNFLVKKRDLERVCTGRPGYRGFNL
jgi:two-component system, OmpR family, phosphate regulon sensor histidine kinase PhoR